MNTEQLPRRALGTFELRKIALRKIKSLLSDRLKIK